MRPYCLEINISSSHFFCTSGKETVENLKISRGQLPPCQENRIKRQQTVRSAGCQVLVPDAGFRLALMPSYCRFQPIECSYSESVSVSVPQDKIRGSAIPACPDGQDFVAASITDVGVSRCCHRPAPNRGTARTFVLRIGLTRPVTAPRTTAPSSAHSSREVSPRLRNQSMSAVLDGHVVEDGYCFRGVDQAWNRPVWRRFVGETPFPLMTRSPRYEPGEGPRAHTQCP